MDQSPTTERRIISRVVFATLVVLVVVLLTVLVGVVRMARHRAVLLERLMDFEDVSVSASYEPYHYSPPLLIGGLGYERGGLRMHRFSLSGEQPFWADLVANIFDDHPFSEIYEVAINNQRFSDADMPVLDELPGLKVLDLSLTGVTDDGVRLLTKNEKLAKLDLSRTQISDRTLLILDKLPELRELDVAGTKVTKGTLQEFRKRHPDCLVFD